MYKRFFLIPFYLFAFIVYFSSCSGILIQKNSSLSIELNSDDVQMLLNKARDVSNVSPDLPEDGLILELRASGDYEETIRKTINSDRQNYYLEFSCVPRNAKLTISARCYYSLINDYSQTVEYVFFEGTTSCVVDTIRKELSLVLFHPSYPKNAPLATLIPQPPFAHLNCYATSSDSLLLFYSNVSEDSFYSYQNNLYDLGWSNTYFDDLGAFLTKNFDYQNSYTLFMTYTDSDLIISIYHELEYSDQIVKEYYVSDDPDGTYNPDNLNIITWSDLCTELDTLSQSDNLIHVSVYLLPKSDEYKYIDVDRTLVFHPKTKSTLNFYLYDKDSELKLERYESDTSFSNAFIDVDNTFLTIEGIILDGSAEGFIIEPLIKCSNNSYVVITSSQLKDNRVST